MESMRTIYHEAWTDQATETLRTILPGDFPPEVPVYLVPAAQLDLPQRSRSVGYTHPLLDLLLQRHLTECRRWRGRGFAAVMNSDLLDEIDERDGQVPGQLYKHAANAVHEALHWILSPQEAPELAKARDVSELPDDLQSLQSLRFAPDDAPDDALSAVSLLFHGAPFQRLAEHALHRIARAGFKCTHEWLGLWEPDSPPGGFRAVADALRDEVQRCESWPLRLVAAAAPPAEYAALFDR